MIYRADLHIHSCLSPCGDLEMSPRDIVMRARERGLNLVAISDHNSAKNCDALADVCREFDDIDPLFGIEVTSAEEVHNLCLFDSLDAVHDFDDLISSSIVTVPNNPEKFGDQIYVDANDEIIGEVDHYLGGAVQLSIDELLAEVGARGGMFAPAHINRRSHSMASQLGFVPECSYDAVEISKFYFRDVASGVSSELPLNSDNYPFITNSDSHYLESIGMVHTEFNCGAPTIAEVRKSLLAHTFRIVTPWT